MMPKAAICVATYRRLQGLNRLLESLSCLRFQKQGEPSITVIIVDNDASGTALSVVERWKIKLPWPLIYDIEPRRGISFARNRLVSLCEDTDFVAFLDDDEVAYADWLDELLYAQKRYQAHIVSGPVLPCFEVNPPQWIVRGAFFERRLYADGELIDRAGTGNVLITREVFSWVKGPFDERMNLSGGGDSLLFHHLLRYGAVMVFSSSAIVEEFISPDRMTVKWLSQRAFRGGNCYSLEFRCSETSQKWIMKRSIKGLGRIVQGILLLFPSIFISRSFAIKALQYICKGVGNLSGLFGYKYLEYKSSHGQ